MCRFPAVTKTVYLKGAICKIQPEFKGTPKYTNGQHISKYPLCGCIKDIFLCAGDYSGTEGLAQTDCVV